MFKLKLPLRISFKPLLESEVSGHEGSCLFTWENKNQIDNRMERGVSGFFRHAESTIIPCVYRMTGEEFHGIVFWNTNIVETTELRF